MAELPLMLPTKKWKEEEQAELELRRSTDAVTDDKKLYIRRSNSKEILVFDLESKKWNKEKLVCTFFRSALVIVNGKLITVGGTADRADDSLCSDQMFNVSDQSPWSRMNEPRSRCTSITYKSGGNTYIIIAGGENPVGNNLKTVEVLNITRNSKINRHTAYPLPSVQHSCSAAIVSDNLYLLGGWLGCNEATRKVFKCSITDLIKSCCSSSSVTAAAVKDVWTTLDTEAPVAQSTCVAFKSKLLTFGGTWCKCYQCKCNKPSREIYMYDEDNERFECIGSTPNAQYLCFACVFQGSKIFVAGGAENDEYALKDVHIYYY